MIPPEDLALGEHNRADCPSCNGAGGDLAGLCWDCQGTGEAVPYAELHSDEAHDAISAELVRLTLGQR